MLKPSANIIDCPHSSRYSLVVAVAKRARQIAQEAEETKTILVPKPVELAVRDFVNHRCEIIEPDPSELEEEETAVPAQQQKEAVSETPAVETKEEAAEE
ncbi:MAG TPA: DNA-directed RNA polymerase subunit omega [Candidatus Gallacutalibacter pullistercoris]|nr:DNA-directed RNA polymerase subunit omega [Candidatus Gallacutalibacter pullistercoris]